MNNLQESILDAMKVFIKDSTSKLNFPLVLECEIVRCSNEDEGEYEVNYLDNHFYAYGQYKGFKYNVGEVVYVLIPKGDFSKTKIIIGLEKDGIVNSEITDIEANPINLPTKNLRTIKIGDTIYEVMGSSAEAVTDVKVNGTSVVNEDKVANISVPTDTVTSNQMEMAIDTATRGLASETYVNNAVSSKADATEVSTALSGKVDKINGKGLSSNDYTNADKYIVSGVTSALADKVDKVAGKGLSTNDYDNTAKGIVDGVTSALANKADKSEIIDVEANPSGTGATDLTKLKVGDDIYNIPSGGGGTTVVANPSGTATDELEKIKIGQTIYSLPKGGGSIDTIAPSTEYAASERNSTTSATYTATDDMYAIAVNLSINGEASNYTQTCSIATDGEILDTMSNHQDTWSSPNRNYAITVDSLNLESGNDVTFSNTGTATYIVRLRGVIGLNQEVRLKEEISNVITADNNNNSRAVTLSPDKVYMVLAFGTSGNGGVAGDINVTSTGTMTFTTLSAQSAKMICAFIVAGSSVTISFGNDSNYYSKGHIIYEVDVKKVEYATKEDLENYVVANPEDTPTDDISSIKIGDTVYGIPSSGSSTNYGKFKCELIFNTATQSSGWSDSVTVCTKDVLDEYDAIYVTDGMMTNGAIRQETKFVLVKDIESIGDNSFQYMFGTDPNGTSFFVFGLRIYNNNLIWYSDRNGGYLFKVYGLKFENKLINRSDIYSEEERMIGRWIDGKPLYQKTYKNLGINLPASTWTPTGITFSDIDYYKVISNKSYLSDAQSQYPMLYRYYQGTFQAFCQWQMPLDELTIQYTKTTDTPDSGVIPEDPMIISDPMIYSEEEQVVGSWTDGKPLYQKTFLQNWTSDGEYHIDVASLHIDKFIKSEGYANRYDTNEFSEEVNANYINNISTYKFTVWYSRDSEYLRVLLYMPEHRSSRQSITIQYTKTTDSVLSGPKKGKIVQRSDIYSEEERLIGRWTDGKPLYQKTVVWDNPTLGRVDNLPHGINNVDHIHISWWKAGNITGIDNTDSNYWADVWICSDTVIHYRLGPSWGEAIKPLIVTFQYTKTTDLPFSKQLIEDPQFVMMSDYYSEDEQVVGRWTDGKPIYQKTYIFGTGVVINNQGVSIAQYLDNLSEYDMIVDAIGYGIGNGSTWCDRIYLDRNGKAWCAEGMTTHRVTLQYTKTTDAPGTGPTKGNLIYLPALYSEEEREVGVWTDGKPLYQKTINVGSITAGGDKRVSASLSIDKVIDISGNAHSSNYNQWVKINFPHQNIAAYIVTAVYIESSQEINVHTGTYFTLDECYITLQYTKTTDQPGSGTFLTDGTPSHHYSTSEKVVGTWIDNSTLYEITVNKGSVGPSGSLVMDRKTMLMNDVLTYLKTSTNSLLYCTNHSDVIWEVKAENYGTDTAWNDLIISGSGGSPSIIQQDNKDTLDIPFGTVGTYTLPDTTGDKTLYTVLRMDSTQVSGDYGGLIGFMYADNQQNTPMFMIKNDNTNTIYRAVYGASWDYNTGKSGLIDHVLVISIDSTNKIAKFFVDGESAGQAPYYNYGDLRLGARLASQSTNVGVKYIGVTDTFDSDDTIIKNTQSIINYYGI